MTYSEAEKKYARHLGKATSIEVGGDTFYMSPLGGKHLAKFLKVVTSLSGLKEKSTPEEFAKVFTEDNISDLIDLMVMGFSKADPGVNVKLLESFVGDNFWEIFPEFVEINGMKDEKAGKLQNRLQQLKNNRDGNTNKSIPSSSEEGTTNTK